MISKEQLEQIENELNDFDLNEELIREALDHNESASINEKIAKVAQMVTIICSVVVIFSVGGVWGKVAGGAFVVAQLAALLQLYSSYRAGKKIRHEYTRFLKRIKEKGIYDGNQD